MGMFCFSGLSQEGMNYFDQEAPGIKAKIFAAGIISTKEHQESGCCFSPDGKEFYFSRMIKKELDIYVCYYKNNQWTKPKKFLHSKANESEPYITWDNKRMYFTSSNHQDKNFKSGIWYVDRTKEGWTQPKFFRKGMYVSSTKSGRLYYSEMLPNGWISGEIVTSLPNSDPVKLNKNINSPDYELHPFVSPNQKYLIYVTRRAHSKDIKQKYNDFYISFLDKNKQWGKPKHLGALIGKAVKMCPYVSPDGNYLFFSCNKDIYWISTKILDQL